jgi:hypothetical protein
MGKHQTQKEKLLDLRGRLANDESIPNRQIRAAFGTDDYKIYEEKLAQAKKDNNEAKVIERTPLQRQAEEYLKLGMMYHVRNGTNNIGDTKLELAAEIFQTMTPHELAEMNYWELDQESGRIEVNMMDGIDGLVGIYKVHGGMYETMADIKERILGDSINAIIGPEKITKKEADVKLDVIAAGVKLRKFNKSLKDEDGF